MYMLKNILVENSENIPIRFHLAEFLPLYFNIDHDQDISISQHIL